jgi:stress-induced morphogen
MMRQYVDLECGADFFLVVLEERLAGHDAGVVHQHRHIPDLLADPRCHRVHCLAIRHITPATINLVLIDQQSVGKRSLHMMDTVNA